MTTLPYRTKLIPLTLSLLTALAAIAAFTPVASAQSGSATKYLKTRHDKVAKLLKGPQKKARDEKVTAIIAGLLDYETLSKNALSRHWDKKSEAERKQFVSLLRQLVERNYRNSIEDTLDYKIKYGTETTDGDSVLVPTNARSRSNKRAPAVQVDYRVHEKDGSWAVTDIVTDGVSMVKNYRRQFNRIIRKNGWDGLIERMQKRLDDENTVL